MDLSIGDKVFLITSLPYLKTSDQKPILRPPDLVSSEEIGLIVELSGTGTAKVRFRRGTFLIPIAHLSKKIPK